MRPSSRFVFWLGVVAAATLIAGIVSSFSVGGGSSTVSTAAQEAAVTTTLPGLGTTEPSPTVAAAPTPGAKGTTTTVAGARSTAPATTAAPLTAASGPVGDPGQMAPEAAGKYTYDYSASGASSESGTVAETVQTVSSAGGVTRQSQTDNGPSSNTQKRVVDFRPAGFFEIQRDFDFDGQSAQCTWTPAVEEVAAPLAVGKQWSFSGSCQVTVYGQPVTVKLTGTGRVSAKERLQVGGDAVNVWVIPADTTIVANTPTAGTFTIHSVGTNRVAGRLGLLVEADATTTFTSSQGSRTETTHSALRSIHPQ